VKHAPAACVVASIWAAPPRAVRTGACVCVCVCARARVGGWVCVCVCVRVCVTLSSPPHALHSTDMTATRTSYAAPRPRSLAQRDAIEDLLNVAEMSVSTHDLDERLQADRVPRDDLEGRLDGAVREMRAYSREDVEERLGAMNGRLNGMCCMYRMPHTPQLRVRTNTHA
jgi:hypothetical protein